MFYVNINWVISVVVLTLPPLCYSKCDHFYVLMKRSVDIGVVYRPFTIGNSTWNILDINTNKTIDALDMNCVLDLRCENDQTDVMTTRVPVSVFGSDTTFRNTPIEKSLDITTTPFVPPKTTTYLPTEQSTRIETTEAPIKSTEANPPEEPATTENIDHHVEESTTERETTTTTKIIDVVDIDVPDKDILNKRDKILEVTTELSVDTTTVEENNATEAVTEINVTIQPINEDNRNKTNITGAFYGKAEAQDSRQLATKITAGVVGTAAAGGLIFGLKTFIQRLLQSGVYRIPDP